MFWLNEVSNCIPLHVSRGNERDLTLGKSKLGFVYHVLEGIPPFILGTKARLPNF